MEQRKVDISYRMARLKSEILCAQTLLTKLLENGTEIAAALCKENDLKAFRRQYPAIIADLDNKLHYVVQFNCVIESQIDGPNLTKNKPVCLDGKKDVIQASSDDTLDHSQDDITRPVRVDSQPEIQNNVSPAVIDLLLLPTIGDSNATSNNIPAESPYSSEESQIEKKLLHQFIDRPLPALGTSTEIDEYISQPGSEETQIHNNLPSTLNRTPASTESNESSISEDDSRPGSVETLVHNLPPTFNHDPPVMGDSSTENSCGNDNSRSGSDETQIKNIFQPSTFNSPPETARDQYHPSPALEDTTVISSDEDAFSEEESKSTIIIEGSTRESRSGASTPKSDSSAIQGEEENSSVNILSAGEPIKVDHPSSKFKDFSDESPQTSSTNGLPMVLQEPKHTIFSILENQTKAALSHTNTVTSKIRPFRPHRPRMQNRNKITTSLNNPKQIFFGTPSLPFSSEASNSHSTPGWNNNRFPSPKAFRPSGHHPHKSGPGPIQNGAVRSNVMSNKAPCLGTVSKGPAVPSLISKFPDDLLTLLAYSNDWFGLVAHAINPSEFYFHVSSADNDKIDQFHTALNSFYQSSIRVPFVHKWEVRKNVGDFCACYFHDNSATVPSHGWYRGQVVDWLPDCKDKVVMQLVDYGNKFTAELADIQPLLRRFAERAVFATRCHLSYLKPPHPCKEWPQTASAIFQKHLRLETMEKSYMISPTGKEETPPFCRHPLTQQNHSKSVPVILVPDDNSGTVNDYLLEIEFAEFDAQMEARQVEAMEDSHREKLREKEIEESRRKVEEWCMKKTVVERPKRPAREPSPEFRLSTYNPPPKAKPPPPDEMDEWDPMKEDFENAEMNDEDPCVAVTGYAPTDESRICRFFADGGHCPWGSKCRREHVLSNIHGITTDNEEVFCSAFNELPMRINGEHLFIKVTSAQCGYFYAIEQSTSALDMLCDVINARANVAAYKRLKIPPALGQIVLAKASQDNRFYRARIIDGGDSSLNAFVFFVDFGNWELVPEIDLREIEPRFMHLAFQAIRCTIFNVELFKEMYEKAAQFLTTEYGFDAVLEVVVVGSDGTTIHVLATDKDHNDVGERMIMNGFGSLIDFNTASNFKFNKPGNGLPG